MQKGFRVHGHVQGVGFRWWARSLAERIGLAGTVRNCSDGTVEVQLSGSGEAVEEMRQQLERGPPVARVERVEEITSSGSLPDAFRIIH